MSDAPSCWNCGAGLGDVPLPVSRHEYCDRCAEPVHCCRMCVHFDSGRTNHCREDRAEPPTDETCANFCDYFTVRIPASGAGDPPGAGPDDRQARARAQLDALFGDDSADS